MADNRCTNYNKRLNLDEVKDILEKCLKENKYFKVCELNYKGNGSIPEDWWEGKITYYRYKNK